MIREYDIVKILRKLISEMVIKVSVKSFIDNADGTFVILTCNRQYLTTCSIFEVNGNEYTVESVEDNTLTIKGSPVLEDDFVLPPPLFIPDTPRGTNNELMARKSELNRHPFVWLLENFPTVFDTTTGGNIAASRVRLFFLNASDDPKWLEGEHRLNCIEPMINLCDAFILDLEKKVSGKAKKFTVTNRLRFGKTDGTKKIFDENLSGVELDINIDIKKWSIKCVEC
jgi:hypothetical protein